MEKILGIPETAVEVKNQLQELENLADRISILENRILKITGKLNTFDLGLETTEGLNTRIGFASNIIPFPGSSIFRPAQTEQFTVLTPLLAMPGRPLPSDITDYRPLLQRDGLILLAWDKRMTETGDRYTAYWVTSAGTPRFYASRPLSSKDFSSARPDHKSYAAEDGIEFYGQKAPSCMVHVAPELMKSNPRHGELRLVHISALKHLGSKVDFNYEYLLKKEKNQKTPSKKPKGKDHYRAGA